MADVKQILEDNYLINLFDVYTIKDVSREYIIKCLNLSMRHKLETTWRDGLHQSRKLQTYKLFKDCFKTEQYVDRQLSIKQRSALV